MNPASQNYLRALTLWQPWATLAAKRLKQHETRPQQHLLNSLATTGEWFAIHAAASTPAAVINEAIEREPIKTLLARHGISARNRVHVNMPMGAIIAIGKVANCQRAETVITTQTERALGNFFTSYWAGELKDVIELQHPILAKGAQGLWQVPIVVHQAVLYQLQDQGAAAPELFPYADPA